MSKNIKPCPFCGGEANVKMWCDPDTPYLVMCESCKASVKDYATEAEAIEAWNHRVATDTNVGSKVAKVLNQEQISRYKFGSCGTCGAPVVKPDKYCSECGAKLDWSDDVSKESV